MEQFAELAQRDMVTVLAGTRGTLKSAERIHLYLIEQQHEVENALAVAPMAPNPFFGQRVLLFGPSGRFQLASTQPLIEPYRLGQADRINGPITAESLKQISQRHLMAGDARLTQPWGTPQRPAIVHFGPTPAGTPSDKQQVSG